ncbi:MAG: hypothetical protein ACKVPX_00390 [Myxococcaceae bacterium]
MRILGRWMLAGVAAWVMACGIRGSPRPAPAGPVQPASIESAYGTSGRDSMSRSPFAPVPPPDAGIDPDPLNPRAR